ncbi:hypothetical protein TNCV_4944541 [Trichonephila clavipes]|nr:hypothetical protein TNCV_4944541 [Trichonephila clavipes]
MNRYRNQKILWSRTRGRRVAGSSSGATQDSPSQESRCTFNLSASFRWCNGVVRRWGVDLVTWPDPEERGSKHPIARLLRC